MRSRRERRIEAYRDGALEGHARQRIEARLERDVEARAYLRDSEALGRVVREAWTDTPTPPTPEALIAALRPEMARVDTDLAREERTARSRPLLDAARAFVRTVLRPAPLGMLAAAAAMALVFVWPSAPLPQAPTTPVQLATTGADTRAASETDLGSPSAIYDLAQGDTPLMIFEGTDGSTVIWMLDPDERLSSSGPRADGLA